ncbi:MAG: SDR family oxidoreductase [Hyphomicrobiales bacterium]|nr:SDR family oxidoreductase [Hyphomicrobiales bacterium]
MKIMITGGGGFIGQKLARKLADIGQLNQREISRIALADIQQPDPVIASMPVDYIKADISNKSDVAALFSEEVDVVFHLAAVVSGEAETNFDLGRRVNLDGSINILDAAARQTATRGNMPVVIFASSVAVHGGEAPELISDGVELNPQTSYGTQKAMIELLLQDYSRKGFLNGRGLRLPTVTIRPGKANRAASSFMSSIFRDTLQSEHANCPVTRNFPVWHTAPRTVVENFIHAASIPAANFGYNRNLNLPGRTDTIGEMINQMTEVAGPEAEKRITWNRDPQIEKIVMGWRGSFRPEKALALGFAADHSFADSVRYFLEDDIA